MAAHRSQREPCSAHAVNVFDEQFWEQRYRSHAAVWSDRPNPQLVAEAAHLTTWAPAEGPFDLVSAQFMHLPTASRQALFARLATMVAPGGTLLIVGHHPSDMQTTIPRPHIPDLYYTAEEIGDSLDPDQWDVLVADTRPRPVNDPEGQEVTIHDAVLQARKRP
ncbi:MAG: hypothetical protein ACRDTG_27805 [Pseudonocardiaceae bacterium]